MPYRILLAILAICLSVARAQAEYFTITDYDITVNFTPEGYADFEEVIEVTFSEPRHGIFRFIPMRSEVSGKTVDRIIKNIEVDGFKFSRSKENNNLVLKIGDPDVYVDGRQVYRIRYRVLNPLNHFEENDEFYWDLIGISWPVVIENFSFLVRFPEPVQLSTDDVFVYTGASGIKGKDASFQVALREISGSTTKAFMPEEGLTVAVRLDKNAFPPMSAWEYFKHRHGLLLAPIFFLIAGIIARFLARNKRETIMTEYFPPVGISPAIAGGFVDHSVDSNDVLSLIPHLANQGYLRMESEEGKGFLAKDQITFHKLKNSGPELLDFEQEFHNALFSYGDRVELRSLKDKFYMHLNSVQASVKRWIKDQGWYEADQKTMGCITGLFGLIALAWGAYAIFARQNLDGIALIVTGIILFWFAGKFNKRTPAGNETYRKLEGFRQFVEKAEKPVIERLLKDDPMYYDKTMPYALAFGYLKQWNRLFDGLLSQPPSWYTGHGAMHGAALTRSWNTFSESFPSEINQVGSVFSSAPSSSGSGGGGGGGFSGGGSGGGGGGSW